MRADILQPNLDFADAMGICGGLGFRKKPGALRVGRQHPVDEACLSARRLLGDIANTVVAGYTDAAGIRRQLAIDQSQKCRLARAVTADETDLVPCEIATVAPSRIGLPSMRKTRSLMCSMVREQVRARAARLMWSYRGSGGYAKVREDADHDEIGGCRQTRRDG